MQAFFAPLVHAISWSAVAVCVVYTALTDYALVLPYYARSRRLFFVVFPYSLIICAAAAVAGSLYVNGSDGTNGSVSAAATPRGVRARRRLADTCGHIFRRFEASLLAMRSSRSAIRASYYN